MAKKQEPIHTKSFVHMGDARVELCTLNQRQQEYVRATLQVQILNVVHRGQAVFRAELPPLETVFPNHKSQRPCEEGSG